MTMLRRSTLALSLLLLASCAGSGPGTSTTGSGALSSSSVRADLPSYEVEEDFGNVYNIDYLENRVPEGKARELLAKNKFVVVPAQNDEFFPFYERNRYGIDPNFVTTDSMFHTYHLLFEHVLMKTEEERLFPLAESVARSMLAKSVNQYEELKGTTWENAAKRNVGFFAVALKQFDPAATMPSIAKAEIDRELSLIAAHDTVADSPLMNIGGTAGAEVQTPWGPLTPGALKEDYTQYVPRGHYDRSETLKKYFRGMMWFGRLTFRFKNPDEVKSALLITRALDDEKTHADWKRLYDITAFFVGESDDISHPQLKEVSADIYEDMRPLAMSKDAAKLPAFMKATVALPAPKINSMPIFRAGIEDRAYETKGFRFMGQRFTLDSAIMQRLVCRDVGTKDGQELCGGDIPGSRMLPKGLDVAAAFGSDEALNLLRGMDETDHLHYEENMTKLRDLVNGYDDATWTQNLYWSWLHALRPLLEETTPGYPDFMRSQAWVRKQLMTFLGSWTELRHDTILYVKQSYAELGGGPPPEKDDRGYVEPVPAAYERLATLSRMTREGLASRDLLPAAQEADLKRMEELSTNLQRISLKELANEKITEEDYELIRSFGGQLEHLWYEANKDLIEAAGMTQIDFLQENPAAIVADVATDPNGTVLEEATGHVYEIYVLVPIEGRLKVLGGAVYSQYEFPWPMTDRLTDKRWRELLNSNDASLPALPAWSDAFIPR